MAVASNVTRVHQGHVFDQLTIPFPGVYILKGDMLTKLHLGLLVELSASDHVKLAKIQDVAINIVPESVRRLFGNDLNGCIALTL